MYLVVIYSRKKKRNEITKKSCEALLSGFSIIIKRKGTPNNKKISHAIQALDLIT